MRLQWRNNNKRRKFTSFSSSSSLQVSLFFLRCALCACKFTTDRRPMRLSHDDDDGQQFLSECLSRSRTTNELKAAKQKHFLLRVVCVLFGAHAAAAIYFASASAAAARFRRARGNSGGGGQRWARTNAGRMARRIQAVLLLCFEFCNFATVLLLPLLSCPTREQHNNLTLQQQQQQKSAS